MLATLLGVVLIAAGVARAAESFVIEKEFESITCGSSIKLASKASGFRLHSHEVNYGTGRMHRLKGKVLEPGEKSVRLVHSETKFYLGTSSRFQFQNVISGQLEVSARPSTRGDEEVWSVQEGVFFAAMEA
ncbi:hypothetical protein BSLG_005219 [Batrachochytrium salamandrivorans]|nr:hypothetical protein BSLG_005219 [Batrachochytrium salamandrivorans]